MDSCGNILIVEDQPAERDALVRFLRAENYDVVAAANISSALEHIGAAPDLVLSDVRLGAENGIDLLKTWKRRESSTPFILMTAFGDIASAVEAVKSGAEDYLIKPINPAELLTKISQSLLAPRCAAGQSMDQEAASSLHAAVVPLEQIEREAIERTLQQCDGNRTHAAQALGISVRTLQRKLKAWSEVASS
jgi:DNA-binding NtrC family response regulator